MNILTTKIVTLLQRKFRYDQTDIIKILYLGMTFFCVIGAYSILRSLKSPIFLSMVGAEFQPTAKILGTLIMIPIMLCYSKIIDFFKRYQAVCFFFGAYAALLIIFSLLFLHPVIGLQNTTSNPLRIAGWVFEIMMDMFQALVVSTFWGFITSISTPAFATKNYGTIVASSRFGGILAPMAAWFILENSNFQKHNSIALLTFISALLLITGCFLIYSLIRALPSDQLHGYQFDHQKNPDAVLAKKKAGVFEGLRLLLAEPYVMGIFALVFSYEIINSIFDYQMLVLMAIEKQNNVGDMSSFMFIYTASFQALSFFFALLGTSKLIRILGTQACLILSPCIIVASIAGFVIWPSLYSIFIIMVIFRALNYGFNHPIREMLFVPTVSDIQFKSKAWIDSFGRTIAKTSGSTANLFSSTFTTQMMLAMQSSFSLGIAILWACAAFMVGKKYMSTVHHGRVIGDHRR